MTRLACILALALVLAGQARALSCVAPDPATTFNRAAASAQTYIVVHGSFAFDETLLPGMNGKPVAISARFTGKGLTAQGFTAPLDRPVTLDIGCAGPWCAGLTADRPMLAFLVRQDDGLHLDLPACADTVFDTPDAALLDRIAHCFRKGRCG